MKDWKKKKNSGLNWNLLLDLSHVREYIINTQSWKYYISAKIYWHIEEENVHNYSKKSCILLGLTRATYRCLIDIGGQYFMQIC